MVTENNEEVNSLVRQYPIAREGWPYIFVLAILTLGFYYIHPWLAVIPGVLLLFVMYFFRNPNRDIPTEEGVIVSPADGVVMDVQKVYEDRFLQSESIRIRIFLNIFNVHINRSPIKGTVTYRAYRPGKMIPAFKSHASEINEKNFVGIENQDIKVLTTQVTGFIARRIVCWIHEGDVLEQGERFGMIKFGSCTEVFLPPHVEVTVVAGDKVRGGETIVGRITKK